MTRRASFGRRSTPPARTSTREYKVRDANPSPANVTPSSAGNGEDPAGMNWGSTLVNIRSVFGFFMSQRKPLAEGPRTSGPGRGLVLTRAGTAGSSLSFGASSRRAPR